nr:abscisic-aldehyde oxidase-like [Ipomoea batatas]
MGLSVALSICCRHPLNSGSLGPNLVTHPRNSLSCERLHAWSLGLNQHIPLRSTADPIELPSLLQLSQTAVVPAVAAADLSNAVELPSSPPNCRRTLSNAAQPMNGERFELPSADPSTTLLHFLRSHTRFKSPKLGCGEGGCGACVVLLSKYDPLSERVESYTVSSCLTLLCSINGCSVTTSEGFGNKDGFHPIHQRFAGFHASQCGYCTPGMCVSLFSPI